MPQAFIDDSGDVKNQQIVAFTLSGYVFTAHKAMLLGDAWGELLARYDLPYIHTREAIRLDGVFAKLTGDQMNECLVRCAELIRDHVEFELSCVIETAAWERAQASIQQNKLVEHGLRYYSNPYLLQYSTLVQCAHHYKLTRDYRDYIIFFFDNHSVNMHEVAALYHQTAQSAPQMLRKSAVLTTRQTFLTTRS